MRLFIIFFKDKVQFTLKCQSILSKFAFSVRGLNALTSLQQALLINRRAHRLPPIHFPSSVMMLSLTEAPFPSLPLAMPRFKFSSKAPLLAIAKLRQLFLLQALSHHTACVCFLVCLSHHA